jgi:hypothetical protein
LKQCGNSPRIPEYDSQQGQHTSIRAQTFKELDENPLNTAKKLAVLLKLPYRQYRGYLNKLRYEWKYYHQNERGSKCSLFHCYKAIVVFKLEELPRRVVVGRWVVSRARNRFYVWKGRLGRVVWFGTGRVLLFVKRPGNLGRAKQLFCDAFVGEGLLTDTRVICGVVDRIRPKSCHFPYETSERLPRFEIRDFVESHGILIKVGDRSHPNAVEVIAEFTDLNERVSEALENFGKFFEGFSGNGSGIDKVKGLGEDYSR